MYTPELLELIKRVEATRERRLDEEYPLLSADAKQELLEGFHPDYKDEVFRELKVGPSKGDRTPIEYANVFEAYSGLDPDKFDLSQVDHDVDVLVVGGGGAGAAAALVAQGENYRGYIIDPDAFWSDLGTPERYLTAHFELMERMNGSLLLPTQRALDSVAHVGVTAIEYGGKQVVQQPRNVFRRTRLSNTGREILARDLNILDLASASAGDFSHYFTKGQHSGSGDLVDLTHMAFFG